ncbi:MAG: BTAD domain-containing putative transcriptional regulator [Armatimonadota bacterium]
MRQGDREIVRFSTQKTAGLLAYLAYNADAPQARDVLVEIFWPGRAPPSGRNSLNTALSSLRHQLEPPGVARGTIIRSSRHTVQLNPDAITTDVADFKAAVRSAHRASSMQERMQHLLDAHRLYGGELLPGLYEDWVLTEQRLLADVYFDATLTLTTLLQQAGEEQRAIDVAREALSHDPLREEAHGELMRLYAATGQPVAALRQYAELKELLGQELGQTPSRDTEWLAERIEELKETPSGEAQVPERPATRSEPAISSGTITFLLTDIEGSTALFENLGDRFSLILKQHRELLRHEFRRHEAEEISEIGDGFIVALATARDAVACAVDCQKAIAGARWPTGAPALSVRMALYTGDVSTEDGEYHDLILHRASRLLSAGSGGQILCSETTAALLRRHLDLEVALRDLGTYRLRDVPAPERLYQLDYPGMSHTRFPPLRAEAGYPSSLPLQLTRFFGRQTELARLTEMLADPEVRLLTITGPAGSGKTRLAVEAARRALEHFEGAVWFIPLAHVRDPELMPGMIAERCDLPRSPALAPLEQVVSYLSDRAPLLVLDNLEQLKEGAGPVVYALLERLPELTFLATSRQRLNVPGEREFSISPLPTPGDNSTPEEVLACESAQLFTDRAQESRPDFQVTEANAPAVATLCARLEGIPLALELAAARVQVLTPAQMVARLDHRFDLLVSHSSAGETRHSTLRAAIDWSYALLAPEVRRFFANLSVFEGGWTAEAATAVCEEPLALDLLEELIGNSLVTATVTDGEVRFGMLETIRDYALECVEQAQMQLLRERHCRHFVGLCTEMASRLDASVSGVDEVEADRDNLRAALLWAGETWDHRRYARTALELCPALYHCGLWPQMRTCLETALGRLADKGVRAVGALRASLEYELGGLEMDMGDIDRAEELARCALKRRRALGDRTGSAEALNLLGLVRLNKADPNGARECFEGVLRLWPDAHGRARALHNLARLSAGAGDAARAECLYREALECRREADDVRGEAETLNGLGAISQSRGDVSAAREFYSRSLSIYQDLHYPHGIGVALNNLGELAQMEEDLTAAVGLYHHARTLLRSVGSRHADVPAQALRRLERGFDPVEWSRLIGETRKRSWECVLGHVETTLT